MTNRIKKLIQPSPPDCTHDLTEADHKAITECIKFAAKNLFNHNGSLMPYIHMVDKDGCHCVYSFAMDLDEKAKDLIENMMIAFAHDNAKMICFVAEAWSVTSKAGDTDSFKCPPSQHPNRREVVSILYACPRGIHMSSAEIYRPEHATAFISSWKDAPEKFMIPGFESGGRLACPYTKIKDMHELPPHIVKIMEQINKEKRKANDWYRHDDVNWN